MIRTQFAVCVVFAAGCMGDDDISSGGYRGDAGIVTTDAPVISNGVDPALEGMWEARDCSQQFLGVLAVVGIEMQYKRSFFATSDTTCAQPLALYVAKENYTLRGPAPFVAGASEIDYRLLAITMTPLSATTASTWNTNTYCGYSDWQSNVAKEITGRTCGSGTTPSASSIRYDIYKVENGRFYTGDSDTGPGTSDATRPTALGGYFTKI